MSTTHGSGSKLLSASFELREEDNRVPLSELGFYLASKPKHGTMSDNPSARTEKAFKIYCTNKYHKNAHTYVGEGQQYRGNYSKKTSKKFRFRFFFFLFFDEN